MPGRTVMVDFDSFGRYAGPALIETFRGTRTELGGVLDATAQLFSTGVQAVSLLPGFWAGALPSGLVTAETYARLRADLIDSLRSALPVDGVILLLHGAMAADGQPDVEGDLIEGVRAVVGQSPPIAVTLDFHANISPRMMELADVLLPYHTYPHTDAYDRGQEALTLVVQALSTQRRPSGALVQPPLLPAVPSQATADEPMLTLQRLARQARQENPEIVSCTMSGGYPYTDVAFAGLSVLVYTWASADRARQVAWRLGMEAWRYRARFLPASVPPAEAVSKALAAVRLRQSAGPVILVDLGDNIGGGTPGDGTVLLQELLAQGAKKALVPIADPQAVAEACRAGVGNSVTLRVGGTTDPVYGPPVVLTGRVRRLSDGVFRYKGSYMTGREVRMGRTAVVESGDDGTTVLLTERKVLPFDLEQLRSVGLDPMDFAIIVVKAAIAWRAAYGPLASKVIEVDTPGATAADLRRFPYRHLRRPIFPLDDEADYQRHTTVTLRRSPRRSEGP